MGRILHSIDRLPPPLLLADERLTIVPRGERNVIANRAIKILHFIQADHEMTIADRPPMRIRTDDILLVPLRVMQVWHSVRNIESRIHTFRLILSPSAANFDPTLSTALADIHHLPRGMTPRHHELIKQFRTEADAHRPGYRLMIGGLTLELLAETLRCIVPSTTNETIPVIPFAPPPSGTDVTETHVRRAKEFILENYEKTLTLAEIAWSARLSREHLSRLFHETTGLTVFDYLTQIRIEAAKSHLGDTALLINQIASLSGFTSDALFCRTFKKHTGYTPLSYRKQILKNSGFEAGLRYNPIQIPDTVPDLKDTGQESIHAAALARRVESRTRSRRKHQT